MSIHVQASIAVLQLAYRDVRNHRANQLKDVLWRLFMLYTYICKTAYGVLLVLGQMQFSVVAIGCMECDGTGSMAVLSLLSSVRSLE